MSAEAISVADRLSDLGSCIEFLDREGMLLRVESEVDPVHELAGIARALEGRGAVLFERVRGSRFPVVCGLLSSRETLGRLFGLPAREVPFAIADAVGAWKKDPAALSPRLLDRAPANEIVEATPDLRTLPIPQHALKDGGRYLDASLVVACNPLTGEPNVAVHRMMVTASDRMTFLIDPGRHLGEYVRIAEERGTPLPVTICNGPGLAPFFAAALPRLGDNKHHVAHHLIGRPMDMVRGRTAHVPAFASSQFVIEAEILPALREDEGPFAEVTGYYGARGSRWVMRVKAITRRARPVLHTLLSGPEVWNTVGFTAEAALFRALKLRHPEVRTVYLPPGGCGFYQAVIQVESPPPGAGRQILRDAFSAFKSLQRAVVIDTDVDPYDPVDVDWAITTRCHPDTGILTLPGEEGHILNPLVTITSDGSGGTITKIGLDATVPPGDRAPFERVVYRPVDLRDYVIRGPGQG
ncbi:MAG: UbiD family decarboxylase [Steroidobacteraceae bacterium]